MDSVERKTNAQCAAEWRAKGHTEQPKYLGETPVDTATHPEFKDKTAVDWAIDFAVDGLLTDGAHHKHTALVQVVQVLTGTPVHVREAKWEDGQHEFREVMGEPSQEYRSLLDELKKQDYWVEDAFLYQRVPELRQDPKGYDEFDDD